ncbi:MAG: 30S ribosomal protein S4 [Bacteroidetes bacterium]|jgi:small subunit ribosomal protein S4|nr:30S ribosomal protein S4 [Bacteroidota bacterium]MBP7256229.1 30S ribosomal protein S4 [Chitinophagales bacterium]MBK7139310.1 30S ribosomal protein S4 [Bacteroidota bacterium]MBK7503875.1 30S ribosomal protein S4 [Bacteroidota bacterium]MBK7640637.1 30S ribosomal protein S4 [Bacteroidota bacterium]
MARYTGPKTKKARSFGEAIYGYDKWFEKRKSPPGQHGNGKRKGTPSEYAIQLKEKQKAKYTYGLLERQFAKTFKEAARKSGVTGEILLQLLELRLDNTVYRLGLAPSRMAARQLVSHKHITVNGSIVNIPSYSMKVGEVVSVREKSKVLDLILDTVGTGRVKKYNWLSFDNHSLSGHYLEVPSREMIPENIKEQLIVELYSK